MIAKKLGLAGEAAEELKKTIKQMVKAGEFVGARAIWCIAVAEIYAA